MLTVRSITQDTDKKCLNLASCTTSFSVYVSLSKNSIFMPTRKNCAKADAKVQTIFKLPKLFRDFLQKNKKFSH